MLTIGALNFARSTRPKIIARNWDRFGGRAHEIVNGLLLADKLNMDFFFVWPFDREIPGIQKEISFFSPEFVRSHLITSIEMEAANRVVAPNISGNSLTEVLEFVSRMSATDFFVPPNFTAIPCFLGDDRQIVLQDFSRIAGSVTDQKYLDRRSEMNSLVAEATVIHARYGDLINGNWKQYVDPRKFISTVDLSSKIEDQIQENEQVRVVSDSPEIVSALSALHSVNLAVSGPSKKGNRFEIQCNELFALSESKQSFGPQESLFSLFAVHMGAKELKQIEPLSFEQIMKKLTNEQFLKKHYSHFTPRVRGKIESRDITKFLNEHAFAISPMEFKNLALRATRADSHYVLALGMSAVALAFEKDWKRANYFVLQAIRRAKRARRIHSDPLFVAFAIQFAIVLVEHVFTYDSDTQSSKKIQTTRKLTQILQTLTDAKPTQVEAEFVLLSCRQIIEHLQSSAEIEADRTFKRFLILADESRKRDFTSNLLVGLSRALHMQRV